MDCKWIAQQINRRLAGQMSDADWRDFQQLIRDAERDRRSNECRDCFGSGLIHDTDPKTGVKIVLACYCPEGTKHSQTLFAPSDKDKTNPITLRKYVPRPVKKDWTQTRKDWD